MIGILSGPQILLPLLFLGGAAFFLFRNANLLKLAGFRFIRALACGFALYAVLVLFGNFDELRRWRNVKGLLFLTGGAPLTIWTSVGTLGGLAVFVALIWPRTRRQSLPYDDSVTNERGRFLLSYQQAFQIAAGLTQNEQHPILWGMVPLPHSEANKHFCITGATGSGKTTHLKLLMRSVLASAGAPVKGGVADRRALIYDSKRNMLPFLESLCYFAAIYTLDPFDQSGVAWDIAADVTDPASALEIATILIPEEKNSSAPYFGDATRTLLAGLIKAYIRLAPGRWTLRDVILGIRNPSRLKTILSIHRSTSDCIQFFNDERHFPAVLTTIMTKTYRYDVVAALWEHAEKRISLIRDWRDAHNILVLAQDDKHRAALDCINQLLFKVLTEICLVMGDSSTRQNWFFLDELREAPHFDGLTTLLNKGREKGVCVALGFQSISGIRERYGEKLAAEIPGMCSNKTFLRTDDKETAQWASDHFGQTGRLERQTGQTRGRTYGREHVDENESNTINQERSERAAVLPSEFLAIPQTQEGIVSFNDIPIIGAYRAAVSFEQINKWMEPVPHHPPPGARVFMPRTAEQQDLNDWNKDDLKRLGLEKYPELLGPGTGSSSGEEPRPSPNGGDDLFGSLPRNKRKK